MICTAYKSVSLLICATIAPNEKVFGTIGCIANHISAQVGMNAMATGIYPTAIRATGVGWALGLGRVGITGPVRGGVLAALRLDIQGSFLIFGLVVTMAAIAVALSLKMSW
jgi:hypothetical protein